MSKAALPLAYRDSCAHLLIPLNRCRFNEWYLPWKCEVCYVLASFTEIFNVLWQNERHAYEKCQFAEFTKRVVKQDELRAARGGARSN